MSINSVSPVSFKSYVPVYHKAKNPKTGEFELITSQDQIRKCQRFVVSNLNHSGFNKKDSSFVSMFAAKDPDYRYLNVVQSVYDDKLPVVHMATGKDVDIIKNYAKNVGRAKSDALYAYGTTKTYETSRVTTDYFKTAKRYLFNSARRIKSQEGDRQALTVYFEPKFKRNGDFKEYQYVGADFIKHA